MNILARIEDVLKAKGLKKAEVAAALGIQRQNFNVLFRNPPLQRIEDIANVLGISVSQLFVSPEEVAHDEGKEGFCAFIRYKGIHYIADTIDEFNKIAEELKTITK